MKGALLLAAAASATAPAPLQTARPALDYATAAVIRDTCLDLARERGFTVALYVLAPHALPIAVAQMDGASVAAADMARWKATSAAAFGRATANLATIDPPPNAPNVATIGGGVPIYTREGVLLGGVGVSGGRPDDDAACAPAGIEAAGLLPRRPPAQ